MSIGEGVSYVTSIPTRELEGAGKHVHDFMTLEATFALPARPRFKIVSRFHHRSSASGFFGDRVSSKGTSRESSPSSSFAAAAALFTACVWLATFGVNIRAFPAGPRLNAAPAASKSSLEMDAKYREVLTYLDRAGLLPLVRDAVTPHGAGDSFHVTFRFATDDESKASILAILGNQHAFFSGPLGQGHLKDVDATARSNAADFRSVRGVLGPKSLEVMINRTSLLGYADVDRYNLYGGLAPAFAHVFFELLPHWLAGR